MLTRAMAMGLIGCTACYSYPIAAGGVASARTVEVTVHALPWGASPPSLTECPAGMVRVVIRDPWYGNLLRLVTIGIVAAYHVDITCAERVEG